VSVTTASRFPKCRPAVRCWDEKTVPCCGDGRALVERHRVRRSWPVSTKFVYAAGGSLASTRLYESCATPRLMKQIFPQYPENARQRRVQGTVAVDAWMGIDGIPRIGEVVGRVNPDLERSGISALKEWRYEPATCDGKPVEVETVLRVNYSLQSRSTYFAVGLTIVAIQLVF
jgi:TonB family protein